MTSKVRTMTAFGSMPYHKGYVSDKYQYSVLAIDKIPKEEKEMVRAKIKTLTSGKEAQAVIGNGWTYEVMDRMGRVGVLKKNGIEVALFLERQIVREQPGPGDPIPEMVLEDMVHQWQRLDIIGPSATQANFFAKREIDQLKERVELLTKQNLNLQELSDSYEIEVGRREGDIESLQNQIERLKMQLSPADKIIVKREDFKYLTPEQAKAAREKLKQEKKK